MLQKQARLFYKIQANKMKTKEFSETMLQTGFELVDYEPGHAIEILCGGAKEPDLVLDETNLKFVNERNEKGPCSTALFDGRPVSCGGFTLIWPGMAEAWMLFADDIFRYPIDPQVVKKWIYEKIDEYEILRLQAPLIADFAKGIKYARWLGFRPDGWPDVPDGVVMKKYHRDGKDAIMYSIITKGDRRCP